ncbi:hypothetical protein TNCV_2259451 [Trichonephila clavipes]|nr:hypothetical protein TNCV_2259451 [Trichonephila clavipes]
MTISVVSVAVIDRYNSCHTPGHKINRGLDVSSGYSSPCVFHMLPKLIWCSSGWCTLNLLCKTATAGSNVVQSGRPIFDDFFQHLWRYIGNNTANVVFQMVKRLWLIRIDQ